MPRTSRKLKVDVDLLGFSDVERMLKELGNVAGFKVLDKAVQGAGTVMARNARQNAPSDLGHLKKAIGKAVGKKGAHSATTRVGVRNKYEATGEDGAKIRPAKYAHLVEFGTSAHQIKAKGRVLSDGNKVFGRKADHPGQAPHPFLQPTVVGTQGKQSLDKFKERIVLEIRKIKGATK